MKAKPNLERLKRYSNRRAFSLIAIHVLIGIHIAHWKVNGSTLAPLEFNEVVYTIHLGLITAGFLFMVLTMIGSLVFGRFFCSWGCHILALQDASEWILSKLRIKPGAIHSRVFFLTPIAAMLYLFVFPQVVRLIQGDPHPGFHLEHGTEKWASLITTDFWRNLPSWPVTLLTFFTCGFAVVYLLGTRSFCQKACPYGALFSVADKLAPGKIKLTGDCNDCGLCTVHCSSHILIHKEIKQYGKVVNSNCLKDLDCVAVCPNDALTYGFSTPSLFSSVSKKEKIKSPHHFSLFEEILLAVLIIIFTFIYRGLYDSVPFLLSITLATIFSYVVILTLRLGYKEYVFHGNQVFKQGNRIKKKGFLLTMTTFFIFLFSMHSGYIHFHSFMGEQAYGEIVTLMNLQTQQQPVVSVAEKAAFHLEKAKRLGLFFPYSLKRSLAGTYMSTGEFTKAEEQLRAMLADKHDDKEAALRLSKILTLRKSYPEALGILSVALSTNNLYLKHDEIPVQKEVLLTAGHLEEILGNHSGALDAYQQALTLKADDENTLLAIGILHARNHRFTEAEPYLIKCIEINNNNSTALNALAMIAIKRNQPDIAIGYLSTIKILQPENYQAVYNLAILLKQKGQHDKAYMLLKEVTLKKPDHRNAKIALDEMERLSGPEAKNGNYPDLTKTSQTYE